MLLLRNLGHVIANLSNDVRHVVSGKHPIAFTNVSAKNLKMDYILSAWFVLLREKGTNNMIRELSISKGLKETINNVPKRVGDLIELTKTEKWEVSKASLLSQKKSVEDAMATHQTRLDDINQLLALFDGPIAGK